MATIGEHDSAIRTIIKQDSDDTKYSKPFIYHLMVSARDVLMSRKFKIFHKISSESYQTFCMPLSKSRFHDCSCVPSEGCMVMKSTCDIPGIMSGRNRDYLNIFTIEGKPIEFVSFKKLKAKSQSRLQKPYYTIFNNRLYLFNSDLEIVLAEGILRDPLELDGYCDCNSSDLGPCYDSTSEDFPIDGDLVVPMRRMVLEDLGYSLNIKEDEINDARNK